MGDILIWSGVVVAGVIGLEIVAHPAQEAIRHWQRQRRARLIQRRIMQ